MTQTKHTPGPWTKERDVIMANDGLLSICEVHDHSDTSTYHTAEEAQANAHFIVTACNCHEELLEACKAALDYVDACVVHQCDGAIEASKQIRVAIAKAEQGKE